MEFPAITWTEPQNDGKLYGLIVKSKSDLENIEKYYALDLSLVKTLPEFVHHFGFKADYGKFSHIKYVKNSGSYFLYSKLQVEWAEFENTEFCHGVHVKHIKINNCYINDASVDCESLEIYNSIPSESAKRRDRRFSIRTLNNGNEMYRINYFKSDCCRLEISGNPKMKYYEGLPLLCAGKQSKMEKYKNIETVKLHISLESAEIDYVPQNTIDQFQKATESKISHLESEIDDLKAKISQLTARMRN
ncbi:MAG: hypothetical protein CMM93_03190 [Rickettsiales bacterium]|nr:hypothetical protein [Rickettsiales bacterium]|tara:strand:- start:446 stop:1186 length:741 start_codon:yes stop_codon:yes gene_type:complete